MTILSSYRLIASASFLLLSNIALAQPSMTDPALQNSASGAVNNSWQPSLTRDGVYDRTPHVSMALPWQYVREADIMWKKRLWRELDTREKQNVAFRFAGDENSGGGYFIEILIDALKKGKIKAYADERFTMALSKDQIMQLTQGKLDSNMVENPITGEKELKVTQRDFNPDDYTKFRMKEDVIFDRNLGREVTRIIGLAPMKDVMNEDGTYRFSQALFWIYFPDARNVLAQYEVFNPENDIARMTWDDYFENRFFSSRIIKASNPFDKSFKEGGASNVEALYMSQRQAEKMFNKEHDMWVY
jgi:gliding motility associated protien GldN